MLDANVFDGCVRANQQQLTTNLKSSYDFIVCGSGLLVLWLLAV